MMSESHLDLSLLLSKHRTFSATIVFCQNGPREGVKQCFRVLTVTSTRTVFQNLLFVFW